MQAKATVKLDKTGPVPPSGSLGRVARQVCANVRRFGIADLGLAEERHDRDAVANKYRNEFRSQFLRSSSASGRFPPYRSANACVPDDLGRARDRVGTQYSYKAFPRSVRCRDHS